MTKSQIEQKIKDLKDIQIKKFLSIDPKTDGFYNGQIKIYEEWLNSL